jgi:hypothetical protein
MTKHLEELFNIPPTPSQVEENLPIEVLEEVDAALDKIDNALPQVRALESSDSELDELANLAKDKFNDLMDLGMNVEPRISGQIFQTAGVLLGHAITAKQAKIDKKLRMVQLQIQKARLDKTNNSAPAGAQPAEPEEIEGKATVIDRNSLLKTILAEAKKNENE